MQAQLPSRNVWKWRGGVQVLQQSPACCEMHTAGIHGEALVLNDCVSRVRSKAYVMHIRYYSIISLSLLNYGESPYNKCYSI